MRGAAASDKLPGRARDKRGMAPAEWRRHGLADKERPGASEGKKEAPG